MEILKQLESEANKVKDCYFWLKIAKYEIFLGNKYPALEAVRKAKNFANSTEYENKVQSRIISLIYRYIGDGEKARCANDDSRGKQRDDQVDQQQAG